MGGRKFRLGTHRKNEERKKQRAEPAPPPLVVSISLQLVTIPALMISLPLAAYADGRVHSSESLWVRLSSLSLPTSWIIASRTPLTLCKLRVHQEGEASRADVTFTLSISSELEWTLSFVNLKLNSTVCPLLAEMPHTLDSVAAVRCLMMLLDSTNLCIGNPDGKLASGYVYLYDPHNLDVIHACYSIPQQCNGKNISWCHLTALYNRDTRPGKGIRLLPKLKFEHISLTSFSKMRVDLAAQVCIINSATCGWIMNVLTDCTCFIS